MNKAIIILYTHLTPSFVIVLKEILEKYRSTIIVLYWEQGGSTPYVPPEIKNVTYVKSRFWNSKEILKFILKWNIELIYVTAWQDRRYLFPVLYIKRKYKIPIISGFDDVWDNTLRQVMGSLIVKIFGKYFFSHAMVSGPRQYEYARKMGFKSSNILYYLFSCDLSNFLDSQMEFDTTLSSRKSFIFVGQLIARKGIDILSKAYQIYRNTYNGSWSLEIVGNGENVDLISLSTGVTIHGYLSHIQLKKLISRSSVFILPSRRDVSPLVVHEFVSLGFPLILSSSVGNRHLFLIDGFNGYTFKSEDEHDLAKKMFIISQLPNSRLIEMHENSKNLAKQHQPVFVAASMLSLVPQQTNFKLGIYVNIHILSFLLDMFFL